MGNYSVTTEGEEALAAATAETLLQLRGTTQVKAKLYRWGVSFDSTTATAEPVLVRLARQTTDGTATGASEVKDDADDPAAGVTAFHTFTAEPTLGDILEEHEVHPQVGKDVYYALGDEKIIDDAATSRLAIIVTAPAAVNAVGYMGWRE